MGWWRPFRLTWRWRKWDRIIGVEWRVVHMPSVYSHMGALHDDGFTIYKLITFWGTLEVTREWTTGTRFERI